MLVTHTDIYPEQRHHSHGALPDRPGRPRHPGNSPRFDVRTHLYRMTGVDLTAIDGVDSYTALKIEARSAWI